MAGQRATARSRTPRRPAENRMFLADQSCTSRRTACIRRQCVRDQRAIVRQLPPVPRGLLYFARPPHVLADGDCPVASPAHRVEPHMRRVLVTRIVTAVLAASVLSCNSQGGRTPIGPTPV